MIRVASTWAEGLLAQADIEINGDKPWDIQVHTNDFFDRVARHGSLGLGEAYVDGWWDCQAIDQFFFRVLRIRLEDKIGFSLVLAKNLFEGKLFNLQRPGTAFEIGKHHYDVGNELYQAMLGKNLTYTCGYWRNAQNLDQSQEAKLDLVCRKIGLKSGQRVLDIGCGWGSFLKFATEKYGAKGMGITVSKAQAALAQELCQGLPVEIQMEDYRDTQGQFDHIVSLGMFEHVGVKNYRAYMTKVHQLLKDDGLFLLHTIGSNRSVNSIDPWIAKYIFPNSMLPSVAQIGASIENLFVMEDWHNFGADYDKTLMTWYENFNSHWPALAAQYSDRFYRMWKYYLLCCAGSFRARKTQLWQIVLSKRGVRAGYQSQR